jgi:hypothetical protein
MPAAERSRTLREGALRYASLALNLGATRAEATTVLGTAWPGRGRKRRTKVSR